MVLPLAPIVAGFVVAVHRLLGARSRWLFAAVVLVAIVATVRRNEDYRTPVTLWSDTVEKCPDNPRARFNLGRELVREGRVEEGIGQLVEARRLAPQIAAIHRTLAEALRVVGRRGEAEREDREAVRLDPGSVGAIGN
jgi:Flp pilus assembly protein TadD